MTKEPRRKPLTREQKATLKLISANWEPVPVNAGHQAIIGLLKRGMIELKAKPGYVKPETNHKGPPMWQTHLCRLKL